MDVHGFICSTRDNSGKFEKYDIVSRYFAPWYGVPEDPVTG